MSPRFQNSIELCAALLLFVLRTQAADAPIPDPQTIKLHALSGINRENAALEDYSCTVDERQDDLNANGTVKRAHLKQSQRFFVNGHRIDHILQEDGKLLTGSAEKKEQERVDKQVRKFSDENKLASADRESAKQLNSLVRPLLYQKGRRIMRNSKSVLVYDLSGDPNFKASNLQERFAKALDGEIWLDEATLNPVELNLQTDRDVKLAGGLLGNLHKGFQLHLVWQHLNNSVWLEKQADGRGDASELFAHARFAFHETVKSCRQYQVESHATTVTH